MARFQDSNYFVKRKMEMGQTDGEMEGAPPEAADAGDQEGPSDVQDSNESSEQEPCPKLEIELVNGGAILHICDYMTMKPLDQQNKTVETNEEGVLARVKAYLAKYSSMGK